MGLLLTTMHEWQRPKLPIQWWSHITEPYTKHQKLPSRIESISPVSTSYTSQADKSPFLTLPGELRQMIYEFICAEQGGVIESGDYHQGKQHCASDTALTLVSRQIHHETCLLPFQMNEFTFQRWYGSGVHICKRFLQSRPSWQTDVISRISLTMVERDLEGWHLAEGWMVICQILARRGLPEVVPKELRITIDGPLAKGGSMALSSDAPWIIKGMTKLPLKKLVIAVGDDNPEEETLQTFRDGLRQTLETTDIEVTRSIAKTNEGTIIHSR
ncbi:hypothetical protein MMC09_002292 [Bachmanniomyces sp. S44760]|nr:hypothetical protein [Bachmanniomyces sp. S44760]